MAEEREVLIKVQLDVGQLEKNAKEAEKNLKKLTPELKKLKEENKQGTAEYEKTRQAITKYNKQLKDNTKAINEANTANEKGANSLRDMKANILAANIEYQSLTSEQKKGAVDGDKLAANIRNTTIALKNEEKALKTTSGALKQVETSGKPFAEQLKTINGVVKETPTNVLEMNKQIQAYQSLALRAGRTSPVGREALQKAAQLSDKYKDIQNETKRLADDQKNLKGVLEIGKGVVAGYGAIQGAQALLGTESEELRQTFVKLQAVQTALASLDQLRTILQKESSAALLVNTIRTNAQNVSMALSNKLFKQGSVAAKNFSKALLTTGIGAIIAGVGLLIANFDKLKKAFGTTNLGMEAVKESMSTFTDGAKEATVTVLEVENAFALAEKGVISKEEALKTYNDSLGDSFGKMTDVNEAEQNFIDKKDAFIKAAGQRALAQELFSKAAEKMAEGLTASLEDQTSAWDKNLLFLDNALGGSEKALENFGEKQKAASDKVRGELLNAGKQINEFASMIFQQAEETENAAGIASEAESGLETERKKRFEAWKKRHETYLKGAEDLALTLRDEVLAGTELTLEQERQALESHYSFLEEAAEGNTDALLRISEQKNADLAELETKELAATTKEINNASADRVTSEQEKYDKLLAIAKKNKENTTQLTEDFNSLLEELEQQRLDKIALAEAEANTASEQRQNNHNKNVKKIVDNREKAHLQVINNIAIAELELNLSVEKLATEQEKIWQELQKEKIRQLRESNTLIEQDTKLSEQEKLDAIAKNEFEIRRLKTETFEHQQALDEKSKQNNLALSTSFLSTAQGLADGLFQIQQNSLQNELNAITENYDTQTQLLQDQLDAGLISEAQFINQKTTLEANQRAEEAKIKEQQWKKDQQQKYISAVINTALAITSALSTQPFLPLGLIAAASAGVAGGLQVAAIASAPKPKFEKGGAMQTGIFGGKSHANGGVQLSADGVPFGEAERDEMFVIMNRKATAELASLSSVNERTGGVSFTNNRKMARGGLTKFQSGLAVAATSPTLSQASEQRFQQQNDVITAIQAMPNPVVFVEDMTSAQDNQIEIRSLADV